MHSPKHISLLSTLLLLILFGCAKSDEDPSFIYNLDEEFVIRPVELLSQTGSKLTLEISSLQEAPCDDSEILYQYRQINGVSVIKLNDITKSDNCNTTDVRPTANIELNSNASNSRLLNITIKEIIENAGQIDEYDNRFIIRMNSTNGIRISHQELFKIQPSTLWGGADYNSLDSTNIADAFVADIAQMAQGQPLVQGYYGQFELMTSGNIDIWNNPKSMNNRSAFAFDSSMTLAEIKATIDDYRMQYPGMRFFVYNGLGEEL